MTRPLKIIISGEGGQGVQVIGKTLTISSFIAGKKTAFVPNYGVEQRGGVSIAFVQISDKEIPFPKFSKADVLVVLCKRAIDRTKRYITPETLYIYDREQISASDIADITCQKIGLNGQEYAKKYLISKVANVIYLGAIVAAKNIFDFSYLRKGLEQELGAKVINDSRMHQLNLKALEVGKKMVEDEIESPKKEEANV